MSTLTERRVQAIRELAENGNCCASIARALLMSHMTVKRMADRHGIPLCSKREETSQKVAALAKQGLDRQEIASRIGHGMESVINHVNDLGIDVPFNKGDIAKADYRAREFDTLYRSGYTLQQIGDRYGITRERVRQVLRNSGGTEAISGGASKKAAERRKRREAEENAKSIARWGFDAATMAEIREYGKRREAETGSETSHPLRAFGYQKQAAKRRGIEWRLSFAEWWGLWQESGKFEQRGRKAGEYVMCRIGDAGAYALGNVYIRLAVENLGEGARKDWTIPLGVRERAGGFIACSKAGEGFTSKPFKTPGEAHQAYLSFIASTQSQAGEAAQ